MQVVGLHSDSTVENVYDMIIMNRGKRYTSGMRVLFGKRKKSASGQSAAGKISDPRPNRVDCCRSSPIQGCPFVAVSYSKIKVVCVVCEPCGRHPFSRCGPAVKSIQYRKDRPTASPAW